MPRGTPCTTLAVRHARLPTPFEIRSMRPTKSYPALGMGRELLSLNLGFATLLAQPPEAMPGEARQAFKALGTKCPTRYDRYSAHRRWPTASLPTASRRPGRPIGGPVRSRHPQQTARPTPTPRGTNSGSGTRGAGGLGKGGKRREGGNTRRDLGGVEGTHDQP